MPPPVSKPSPDALADLQTDAEGSVIAQRLHDFFADQGLPRHKHASQLAVILGLSRSGAFRKFQDSSFSAGDLQALAQHFAVDVSQLLSSAPLSATPRSAGGVPNASILIGSTRLRCQVQLGDALAAGEHCELVATPQGDDWLVQPYAAADPRLVRQRVLRLVITPVQRQMPRVAVLEDSRDLAANLRDALEASGLRVELFTSAAELSARASLQPFDAYLVDWWLNGQTARAVLHAIRQLQPGVPLVLTTGAIAAGHAVEDEIVQVTTALRIQVVEKPFRLGLMVAQVRQLIEQDALTRV
ncbi:helix-turn-helix domain-containing protein [Pseudorhodoferax sp. Leaf267]|uniref:helix-turn-helix domain-containing protein n=1 Tax=Pseudorhodoferax sp. Leaf267 TaxID=1736316 RepID=UPI0006F2C866|nr:helix-turn-helix domain-containing protein [Pseudorhodoferax sp. Leaf267]KQP15127.1 hypothetical protein ASF43_13950 [Pseudorhodoferax sp. Leaf267]